MRNGSDAERPGAGGQAREDGPAEPGPDAEDRLAAFGLDRAEDDAWLARLRAADRSHAGGRIGPFVLTGPRARGAQGVVFQARREGSEEPIAIKRLAAGAFATAEMRRRFERELAAARALDHPAIVGVRGVEIVDGEPVLWMPWIEGEPITRWARPVGREPRSTDEVVALFGELADAIAHAHEHGVAHRDLKPANVLVDGEGRPRVLDLGLAKLLEETADPTWSQTTTSFVGTPAYAAPERLLARGGSATDDARSDVWSLGALLYECLTGARPIDSGTTPGDLLYALRHVTPPAPSESGAACDARLDAIVLAALRRDPRQRTPSARALADDLARWRRGERPRARRRRPRVAALAFLAALALGATAWLVLRPAPGGSRQEREDRFAPWRDERYAALRGASSLRERAEDLERQVATTTDPVRREGLRVRLAMVVGAEGRQHESVRIYRLALENLERELGPDHPRLAWPLRRLGQTLLGLGETREARERLARALELDASAAPTVIAQDLLWLAQADSLLGARREALAEYRDCGALLVGVPDDATPSEADAADLQWMRMNAGFRVHLLGDPELGRELLLAATRPGRGFDPTAAGVAWALYAQVGADPGSQARADATAHACAALQASPERVDRAHGRLLIELARLALERGDHAEVERLVGEAWRLSESQGGDHSTVAECRALLGRVAFLRGDLAQAAGHLEAARQVLRDYPTHARRPELLAWAAELARARLQLDEARTLYAAARDQGALLWAADAPELARLERALGELGR